MRQVCFLCILWLFLWPVHILAADKHNVGFQTIGFWKAEQGLRLDINVWYPTLRKGRSLNYAPWSIVAARNSKPLSGTFPLLIISHPSSATRFSLHDTCAWLASKGFIVAAPTHAHDCMDNMRDLFTWDQLAIRSYELSATIDLLLQNETFSSCIDPANIGLIGFGSGGSAALLLAGARPDCSSWPDYCPNAGSEDIYCNHWSREKINDICVFFPLKKLLTDPRIRAFCCISPGFGMLFSEKSFQQITRPLLLVGLGMDRLNVSRYHAEKMMSHLRGRAKFVSIPQADLGSLMAPCPESLQQELPELCRSVNAKERTLLHKRLWEILGNFVTDELVQEQNAGGRP